MTITDPVLLHALIGTRLSSGLIPDSLGEAFFDGYGSGTLCACCGHPIERHQIQYKDIRYDSDGREYCLVAHLGCYRAWWQLLRFNR